MNLDNELLRMIHAETVRLENVPDQEPLRPDLSNWAIASPAWQRDRLAREDLQSGFGIKLQLWFGDHAAARARCQRCLTRLELAGLVERVTSGRGGARTTRVKLTPAGRAHAERLESPEGPALSAQNR